MNHDIDIPEPLRLASKAKPNPYRSAVITAGILLYLGLTGFVGLFVYQTNERVTRILNAVETIAQANADVSDVMGRLGR